MQALAASCEELRARTGNPPIGSDSFIFRITAPQTLRQLVISREMRKLLMKNE
jgi:hypothetical protein